MVVEHAQVFREHFENRRQVQHFEKYLTGVLVLENKSRANISRCVVESADKTNLSRFFSEAPWDEAQGNTKRIPYMLEQTAAVRRSAAQSCVIVDDTLWEPVGSRFEYVERHYDHCEGRSPLGPNLVPTHLVRGAVRFPLEVCLDRRYEEQTRWGAFVGKHYAERELPTEKKLRTRLHKEGDKEWVKDPEFAVLHAAFRTKIALALAGITHAATEAVPFQTVLMDRWLLCQERVEERAKLKKDWGSLLKQNRTLAGHSVAPRDAQGQKRVIEGPPIKGEDLVPLIPRSVSTAVRIGERE